MLRPGLFGLIALALLGSSSLLGATHKLTPQQLSELAGETTNHVPEIRRARVMAEAQGARVATYGGTSREVLAFVQRRVDELGGVEAYRGWLKKHGHVHLLDWHRIASDLDFMILPKEPGPYKPERIATLNELAHGLSNEFPKGVFYSKFDVNVPMEFFEKYSPASEHFEAISNIPISDRGVESLPELNVEAKGVKRNLAEWGLAQYSKHELEFERTPAHHREDTFSRLKQALRWIRYLSENPGFKPTPNSKAAIHGLIDEAIKADKKKVLDLLREGHQELVSRNSAGSLGGKLIEALEKLQLYSKDSVATRKLLEEYGIAQLAKEAGIAEARIFEPLAPDPHRAEAVAGKKPAFGKEIKLYHRTSLSAAQNISEGALWKSNNATVIRGRQTAAAQGPGLYAAPGAESLSYGDTYVELYLRPDAIEGVDFKMNGNWFVILHQDAIAKDAAGHPKIRRLDRDWMVEDLIGKLRDPQTEGADHDEFRANLRALATLLSPESIPHDEKYFDEVLRISHETNNEFQFLESYVKREGTVRALLKGDSAFDKRMSSFLINLLGTPHGRSMQAALLPELIAGWEDIGPRHPEAREKIESLIDGLQGGESSLRFLVSQPALVKKLFALFPQKKQALLEIVIKNPDLALSYRWDLADAEQVEVLKRFDALVPGNASELKQIVSKKIVKKEPGLERIHEFPPEFVLDPALRKEYADAVEHDLIRKSLRSAMGRLYSADPKVFEAKFGKKSSAVAEFSFEIGPQGEIRVPSAPAVEKLLNSIRLGQPLDPSEQALLQSYLDLMRSEMLFALTYAGKQGQKLLTDALKSALPEKYKRIRGVFATSKYDKLPPLLDAAQRTLIELRKADPALRAKYREGMLLGMEGSHEFSYFDWDLGRADDVQFLQQLTRSSRASLEAERKVLLARWRAERPEVRDEYNFAFDVANHPTKDPSLLSRLVLVKTLISIYSEGIPELLKENGLSATERARWEAIFTPESATLTRYYEIAYLESLDKYIGQAELEILSRSGLQGLAPEKRRLVEISLKLPVDRMSVTNVLKKLIEAGGEARQLARQRLTHPHPLDDPNELRQLPESETKALGLKAKIRAKIRARDIHAGNNYPWDFNDPKDIELMKWMMATVEGEKKLLAALESEAIERFPEAKGKGHLRWDEVKDPELRKRQHELMGDSHELMTKAYEYNLGNLYSRHPLEFLRAHGKRPYPDATLSPSARETLPVLVKAAHAGPPLSASELQELRLLADQVDPDVIRLLLESEHPESRTIALEVLRRPTQETFQITLELLDPRQNYGKVKPGQAIKQAMATDPKWKAFFRSKLGKVERDAFNYSTPPMLTAWKEYPWDIRDPEDLRLIQEKVSTGTANTDLVIEAWQHAAHWKNLEAQDPKLFAEAFPTRSADFKSRKDTAIRKLTDVSFTSVFFKGGKSALSASQQAELEAFLALPLDKDTTHLLGRWLDSTSRWSSEIALDRLAHPLPSDSGDAIAELVLHQYRARALEQALPKMLRDSPALKAKVLGTFTIDTPEHLIVRFPWDLSREQDGEFLKGWISSRIKDNGRRSDLGALGELQLSLSLTQPSGYAKHLGSFRQMELHVTSVEAYQGGVRFSHSRELSSLVTRFAQGKAIPPESSSAIRKRIADGDPIFLRTLIRASAPGQEAILKELRAGNPKVGAWALRLLKPTEPSERALMLDNEWIRTFLLSQVGLDPSIKAGMRVALVQHEVFPALMAFYPWSAADAQDVAAGWAMTAAANIEKSEAELTRFYLAMGSKGKISLHQDYQTKKLWLKMDSHEFKLLSPEELTEYRKLLFKYELARRGLPYLQQKLALRAPAAPSAGEGCTLRAIQRKLEIGQ